MKKFNKLFQKLFIVNIEAGYLRIFLLIFISFILWSFFAFISSILSPIANLNIFHFSILGQNNLALSIVQDILKAYFSSFALICISYCSLFFWQCFRTIAFFHQKLHIGMSYKDSINYLLNCAFSIPGNKTLFIPQDSVGVEQGSELLYPEGPLITSIAPDHAMVIVTSSNKVGIWVNNNTTERLSVPLNHKEVVLDNFKMQLYTQHIDYHRKIIGVLKPQSGGMQISISYDFSPLNQEYDNRFIENLPDDFNPNNLLSIIEKIISSEVQATLNHLFEDILLKSSSKEISGNSQTVGIVNKIQSIDGRFPAKPFSINYYQNPARQKSKRLRKRPIYAATYLQSKKQIIAESYSSNFSSEFNKTGIIQNIQTAILILFGFDFINIKEISIREIE